ncbi:hypothetical protein NST04_24055 [Paenibacillus sp. FSL H7-0756]|uniref:hypothetical protein n=1 Tax=Paenibacillus sp. FSL H7-0756 TaxID=2954738 RepID=UPI0030F834B8
MLVVNPLFRNQDNAVTAAHRCNCICNVDTPNQHDNTQDRAWWWFVPDCGCGCNSNINENKERNTTSASDGS